MTESFLPLEIDVESLTIGEVGTGEWELKITASNGTQLVEYLQQPDPLFEQLLEEDILVYDEEERDYIQNND